MQKVIENQFMEMFFDDKNSIIKILWLPKTENMEDVTYKETAKLQVKTLEKYNPKLLLVDTKELAFPLTPDIQTWVNENLFPRMLEAGIKRFAFVMSDDFFSQVSVEQLMEEEIATQSFQTKHFEEEEIAKEWLLKHYK